jgi:pyridinium-3,5-bisthiocarboxylic acid mononucleotide nickel chelatase
VEHVHFHEVGAVDSIVDIVAAAIAFDHLDARVACSALPMGRGVARSAHGLIPLPAPATVLCLADAPTYDAGLAEELVTPTGACLCAAVVREWTGWPSFRPERVGIGAGTKQFPDRPNVLRVVLGSPADAAPRALPSASAGLHASRGRHVVLETNIDDLSPEVTAFALQRALAEGALDVWTTAIGMKKGRAGLTISALTTVERMEHVSRVLLSETSSLGIRHYPVDRLERARRSVEVETAFGTIQLKVADGDGLPDNVAPEYESCRHAAELHQIPIRRVYGAALQAYFAREELGDRR